MLSLAQAEQYENVWGLKTPIWLMDYMALKVSNLATGLRYVFQVTIIQYMNKYECYLGISVCLPWIIFHTTECML